jgi:cell division protein FtsB
VEFRFENNGNHAGRRSARSATGRGFGSSTATSVDEPIKRTRRNVPAQVDDIEISDSRSPRRTTRKASPPARISYPKSSRRNSQRIRFEWSWNKLGWMVCGALFLRLIFMDSGVIDYYDMENSLVENNYQLELIKADNKDVVSEIYKIKTSSRYQKKIVRNHLGVIAQDEYLILFAKDS